MDDSAHSQGQALESLKGAGPVGLLGPAGKGLTDPEKYGTPAEITEDVTDASAHVLGKGASLKKPHAAAPVNHEYSMIELSTHSTATYTSECFGKSIWTECHDSVQCF